MKNLDIAYEILTYESYNKRLENLLKGKKKYPVKKHVPIGKSSCGFPIEHYSIGNGPMHIVYMGGAHGNEIIGVDYVTQLMKNLSEGNGVFKDFDPSKFTIDFIPCQNPEGFFTTTYALSAILKGKSSEEIESFSKKYWSAYREDDSNVIAINSILKDFHEHFHLSGKPNDLIKGFWIYFVKKDITPEAIIRLLTMLFKFSDQSIKNFVEKKWDEKFKSKPFIPQDKYHHEMFSSVTIDCIPEIDEPHKRLKEKLYEMYKNGNFPIGTLANFFPNADGVNLNDNNEPYFEEVKEELRRTGVLYANARDNNLSKKIPGPVGMPSYDYKSEFKYAPENLALFEFLRRQESSEQNFAFINCHGTGGMIFTYPVFEDDTKKAHEDGVTRDFAFYINNRIATEYTKETGRVYEESTGKNEPYKVVGYPDRVTGVGDLLRKQYLASFILELSKMGGNPIAPYGDKNGNYKLTMESNMSAMMKMLETILKLEHLYNATYHIEYNDEGQVTYQEGVRKKR